MHKRINLKTISRFEAHHRLFISLTIGLLVYLSVRNHLDTSMQMMLTWLGYNSTVILLMWVSILTADPREIRLIAKLQDSSRILIFLFVISASFASLIAVIILLKFSQGLSSEDTTRHIILAVVLVACSWWLLHTVFTLRYAHLYYGDVQQNPNDKNAGGLDFPGGLDPDYLDFAYFSFIIGMTCQVSDVQIQSRRIRRLAWLHGVLAFAYNTAIVALTINIISSLLEK